MLGIRLEKEALGFQDLKSLGNLSPCFSRNSKPTH